MFTGDADRDRTFPPADGEQLKSIPRRTSLQPLDNIAQHVAQYVFDNFATLTKCTTATDACATTYLNKLAEQAYRRKLTTDEQTRGHRALHQAQEPGRQRLHRDDDHSSRRRSYAVYALLSSPQMLWRWEIGNTGRGVDLARRHPADRRTSWRRTCRSS